MQELEGYGAQPLPTMTATNHGDSVRTMVGKSSKPNNRLRHCPHQAGGIGLNATFTTGVQNCDRSLSLNIRNFNRNVLIFFWFSVFRRPKPDK